LSQLLKKDRRRGEFLANSLSFRRPGKGDSQKPGAEGQIVANQPVSRLHDFQQTVLPVDPGPWRATDCARGSLREKTAPHHASPTQGLHLAPPIERINHLMPRDFTILLPQQQRCVIEIPKRRSLAAHLMVHKGLSKGIDHVASRTEDTSL